MFISPGVSHTLPAGFLAPRSRLPVCAYVPARQHAVWAGVLMTVYIAPQTGWPDQGLPKNGGKSQELSLNQLQDLKLQIYQWHASMQG